VDSRAPSKTRQATPCSTEADLYCRGRQAVDRRAIGETSSSGARRRLGLILATQRTGDARLQVSRDIAHGSSAGHPPTALAQVGRCQQICGSKSSPGSQARLTGQFHLMQRNERSRRSGADRSLVAKEQLGGRDPGPGPGTETSSPDVERAGAVRREPDSESDHVLAKVKSRRAASSSFAAAVGLAGLLLAKYPPETPRTPADEPPDRQSSSPPSGSAGEDSDRLPENAQKSQPSPVVKVRGDEPGGRQFAVTRASTFGPARGLKRMLASFDGRRWGMAVRLLPLDVVEGDPGGTIDGRPRPRDDRLGADALRVSSRRSVRGSRPGG